jgi:hypothetical protein
MFLKKKKNTKKRVKLVFNTVHTCTYISKRRGRDIEKKTERLNEKLEIKIQHF